MPGYTATAADSSPKPGLKCVHCDLLLKDPVQTEEGQRLCRGCFVKIQSLPGKTCKICNTSLLSSENYPDKAVQREILMLQVLCQHHELGCQWQGQLKDWELHSSDCSYKGIACPHKGCGKLLPKKDLQDHEEACQFRPTPHSTKFHFNQIQNENQNLKSLVQELKLEISALTNQVNEIRQQTESYNKKPVIDHTLISKLEELRKSDAEKTATVIRLKTELNHLQRTVEVIKTQSESNIRQFGDAMTTMGVVEQDSVRRRTGHIPLGSSSDSRMAVVEKRVEDLAKQMTLVKVHVQELELQLQASLASTHNGAFLWRIPDVSRRKRDAIEERVTSIYSPPFYTGRNRHRMYIRAYLNGDGMGYKTHLSLFFIMITGEYDLLKWPFEYKISVNHTHHKYVVQTFKPTVESSSFQQPQTDMNVASSCPQFAKDDAIQCRVDTSYTVQTLEPAGESSVCIDGGCIDTNAESIENDLDGASYYDGISDNGRSMYNYYVFVLS